MSKKKMKSKLENKRTLDETLQVLVTRLVKVQRIEVPQKVIVPGLNSNVYRSFTEYLNALDPITAAIDRNAMIERRKEKRDLLRKMLKSKIISILPKYVWFVVDVNDEQFAVGASTDDWGGYNTNLHLVEYVGQELLVLKHNVY